MEKRSYISIISFLISLGLIFFVAKPLWSYVGFLRNEIGKYKDEKSEVQELISKTNQLKQKYQQVREEAERAVNALPQEQDVPYLIVQFDALASNNGLLLSSMNFSAADSEEKSISSSRPSSSGNPSFAEKSSSQIASLEESSSGQEVNMSTVSANLSLSGAYSSFKAFLASIEKNIQPMNPSSITFAGKPAATSAEEETSVEFLNFSLKLEAYYLK